LVMGPKIGILIFDLQKDRIHVEFCFKT
jgi:hypothetical protein